MDFIMKLPKTLNGDDMIWVLINHLTKSSHFLPIKETDKMEKSSQDLRQRDSPATWNTEIYHSDKDNKFTSLFWKKCNGHWEPDSI